MCDGVCDLCVIDVLDGVCEECVMECERVCGGLWWVMIGCVINV